MYEKFYGFKERPFQLTPSPNWFYASKLHKRALAYLQYGLSQGEGFIVITGDIGTGKTTIANQLLSQLSQDEIIAKQIVTSKLAPDDLIRMIASCFNLVVAEHTKANYLDAIYNYLKRLHSQHRRALLLVDEAQNLPLDSIEELRMLSNFQFNGKPLLQSFLLGQNELNAIIQAPNMEQFRQRIIASSNLAALQPDDTKAYIQYRIQLAGGDINIIHDDCYDALHQQSKGIPRKINTLMDRVMLYGYLEDKQQLLPEDIQLVIAEINQEVANMAPTAPVTQSAHSFAPADSSDSHQTKLSATLNSVIEEKLKLLQEMDELLKKQHKALAQREDKKTL